MMLFPVLEPLKKVLILVVPYDSGQRAQRMGAGPQHWLTAGLADQLKRDQVRVTVETIESPLNFPLEVGTMLALNQQIAIRIRQVSADLTIILSGNCSSTIGAVAGQPEDLGVIWFDAHGDFNTPDTTVTGFFDGMGLAALMGYGWNAVMHQIPGFRPVRQVIHIGGRDFDPEERERMIAAGVQLIDQRVSGAVLESFKRVHVHLDLDVLDQPVNPFFTEGGLRVDQVRANLTEIATHTTISSLCVSAYDPRHDEEGRVLQAGLTLMNDLIDRLMLSGG
ncbi:MAG: arginase family protein [Anaerolineae bacterium]|nr:arginase family protein [Anaerolineae bacterium]